MPQQLFVAALLAGAALAGPALAQDADVTNGQKIFKRCAACHAVGPDAKNRVGPELNGVIGRTAGGLDGFNYSDPMKAAGEAGLVWNVETMDDWLADPRAMVKGNKMAFVGLKNEKERADVIAYIIANGGGS